MSTSESDRSTHHASRLAHQVGVFLRCVGIDEPAPALRVVGERLGLRLVQISKLPDRFCTPGGAAELGPLLEGERICAESVVIVHAGESYKDVGAVWRTVGYLPEATLGERLAYSRRCIDLAAALAVNVVTTHMGFLPEDPADAGYRRLLTAVREVGLYANARGATLALETGQESAEQLLAFMDRLPDVRLGVNFDPGNFAIYGSDDALTALHLLRPRVVGVHVKDGRRPVQPDQLGAEARPGEGETQLAACLRYLAESGYKGSYVIENYIARAGSVDDKLAEIDRARRFVLDAVGAG